MAAQLVFHELEPIFDQNSKVLILGTMPSPMSRKNGFYYAHPQNKFWRVISDVFNNEIQDTKEARTSFLYTHHIALWDVLKSCDIEGADDGSIIHPVPNDLRQIFDTSDIQAVFTTGKKATDLYRKLCYPQTGISSIYLPSTSPANCRNYSYVSLVEAYRSILNYDAV